ncbi:MAG: beta-ketoacyl-ACP reductase [Clostridiales bacterium]|jgi:3-oxoacyl-[acyl-carrier protein] reductase|nr:beta-ketoacyl-ACP reductase [Clostridiales bacterium]
MLKEKIAIVTGGASGIGAEIVKVFEAQGASVEVCSIPDCDVSKFDDCQKFVENILNKHGRIDILVNNAGITRDSLMLKMTEDDFKSVIDVNLGGTFNMTKNVLPAMLKTRQGRIINMASVMGVVGNAGQANYSASKAGIIGFTKSVAKEAGSRGITSNAIAPGFIGTAMTQKLPEKVREEYVKRVSLRREGTPNDVANAALFLASDMGSYVTGQVIVVDGGLI